MDAKETAELDKQRAKHKKAQDKALDRKRYRGLFDTYVDELVPKMAGHKFWPPSKRHYVTIMHGGEGEGELFQPYVSPEDEAMLVLVWENCYSKWWYKEECSRSSTMTHSLEDKRAETPYTDQKGGQAKFGGWLSAGIKRYKALCDEVKEGKLGEDENFCKEVEELCLKRLRKKHGRDESDAKRKAKKPKVAVAEESESEDDVDDFGHW
jgi:hypothetical protein